MLTDLGRAWEPKLTDRSNQGAEMNSLELVSQYGTQMNAQSAGTDFK